MPGNAETFFNSLKSAADVSGLVGQPENLYFEAKTCRHPLSDADKDHLAEALSGFANADGGVLIYGLVAKGGDKAKNLPDIVKSVHPLTDVSSAQAEILSLVGQFVQPPVQNVNVAPRSFERKPAEGFILVHIPVSETLHRSVRDREWYRRHGSGFFKMEHFEIAEAFGRKRRPQLELFWDLRIAKVTGTKPGREAEVRVLLGIRNVGLGMAKYPALLLRDAREYLYGVDGNGTRGLARKVTVDSDALLYGGGANDVIYPGGELPVTVLEPAYRGAEAFMSFSDVEIAFEIYSENAENRSGTITLEASKLQEKFLVALGM